MRYDGGRRADMKRPVLNLLTALSLLLCVAAVVLWARSGRGGDCFSRGKVLTSGSDGVRISVCQARWTRGRIRLLGGDVFYYPNPAAAPVAGRSAHWDWARLGPGDSCCWDDSGGVALPAWLPAAIFAAPVLARVPGFALRRRRRRSGQCLRCGYDLRATPGRCPECGAGAGDTIAA
jgi:hypothetical protein